MLLYSQHKVALNIAAAKRLVANHFKRSKQFNPLSNDYNPY